MLRHYKKTAVAVPSLENSLTMASERLQKIMAASGIASRRKAEEIIAAGRVTLNGKVVVEQGTKADPEIDAICVDGKPLKRRERGPGFFVYKARGGVRGGGDTCAWATGRGGKRSDARTDCRRGRL